MSNEMCLVSRQYQRLHVSGGLTASGVFWMFSHLILWKLLAFDLSSYWYSVLDPADMSVVNWAP